MYDSANVDGSFDEWVMDKTAANTDFFTEMYRAGNSEKDMLSSLYLRYSCETNILFTAVKTADGHTTSSSADDAWIKVYNCGESPQVDGSSGDNNVAPDFTWVYERNKLTGYEASFKIDPGTYNFETHLNVDGGETSSTGKKANPLQLYLQCQPTPPPLVPNIDIEKATNGHDADQPTGPEIEEDEVVTWTYVVTNTGETELQDIVVTDNKEGVVNCPVDTLAVSEDMTCTKTGTAIEGQYANIGTVTAKSPSDEEVTDQDPSHYFGLPRFVEAPLIDIEKATNGRDADNATGPKLLVGTPVTWTYVVTNVGNVPLTNIIVNDDDNQLGKICTIGELAPGESDTCTIDLDEGAVADQYKNIGTACSNYTFQSDGTTEAICDEDPSHYFGLDPKIDIEKSTQGRDADTPDLAPAIEVEDTVFWSYKVTNTGNVDLENIVVSDYVDGLAGEAVDCGDGNDTIALLEVGSSFSCSAINTALEPEEANPYRNDSDAITTYCDEDGNCKDVEDEDPSHYISVRPGIDIEKHIVDQDVDEAPGAFLLEGDQLNCEYFVTNTGTVALANVVVTDNAQTPESSDDFNPIYVHGDTNNDDLLDVDEGWYYTSNSGTCSTAELGQHTSIADVVGEYTVVITSGAEETRDVRDNDPVNYYAFVTNRPSLEVYGLEFTANECATNVTGSFIIENASDGDDVSAIGITNYDMLFEVRNGRKWSTFEGDCSFYDNQAPDVLDPVSAIIYGTQGVTYQVYFSCDTPAIPSGETLRLSSVVEIFNRDKTFSFSTSTKTTDVGMCTIEDILPDDGSVEETPTKPNKPGKGNKK
ncbi:hypothetical protein QUF54_04645 [Candidatus Marithioploca araucensis]|uniref:DUF7507 domain-containing protein n=1 Tax=Candidatus Marithioploca araucensis TaxID=70273 RepID=A0ABT7VST3_9GAMM|nr:hypothetical protein [Candidatus Marithioploca araucensis]